MTPSFFIHAGHKLIQFRNSEDTFERATLNIKYAKLSKVRIVDQGIKCYGFVIMARHKQFFFFVESKLEQYQWMRSLSKSCVLHDIHSDYQIGSILGRGSFAQVYACNRKSSK